MLIQFHAPLGNGPDGQGLDALLELPAVPRKGEYVRIDDRLYVVDALEWMLRPAAPIFVALRDY